MDRQSVVKSTAIPFPLNFDNQKYEDMYKAYNKIMILARDLNAFIEIPEFVFIGKENKSTLIESFIGFSLGQVCNILRPLHISLNNNPRYDKPTVTFKRDRSLDGFEVDKLVEITNVAEEISKRNSKTNTPIEITIEYKYYLNMLLIEPPNVAIQPQSSATVTSSTPTPISLSSSSSSANLLASKIAKLSLGQEMGEMILTYTKPTNRTLIFVDNATKSESEMLELAKKLDYKLDRSIFVFNKFNNLLTTDPFSNGREANRFLGSSNFSAPTFFTTLPVPEQSSKCKNKEELQEFCEKLQQKDLDILEQLQFDKKFERNVGLTAFKHFINELSWRKYLDNVPEVLKRLNSFRTTSEDQLSQIRQQLDKTNAITLRQIANSYVSIEFIQCIEKLVTRTLEGNPSLNGQTLEEEKSQDETGDWYDHNGRQIILNDEKSASVPFSDNKLYGGQQFERLLSEFKCITEVIELDELSGSEIACAIGSNRPSNVSVLAWAASDLAQKKIKEALLPLVDQLFKRSTYILRRLVDIVDRMIENKKKSSFRRHGNSASLFQDNSSPSSSNLSGYGIQSMNGASDYSAPVRPSHESTIVNVEDHPYFIYYVKEMYFKYVDQIAADCKNKCMDEFYTTRLIYWDLQSNKDLKKFTESPSTSLNNSGFSTKSSATTTNTTGSVASTSSHALSSKETHTIVTELASKLFQDIRNRISKNIMLKCYNYFLIPMQMDLKLNIQDNITKLTDTMLEEIFEVQTTKERLREDERHLSLICNQFVQQEENYKKYSHQFSHPAF
ncbi:hypothetical protein DICPUDRAFT_93566 [Dictyostelium purpureum]|uniref:Dynamin-type G domain-containing protein n=1 Tax=Dictyostelium purpureum TaxID=5786 RepID=F0Z938_DICPU|nr:uncharacterized protein DICPUDRAFT_93566 [Dictyostelium purpureum]EGC39597.1 hypothetical protein DICPUDRAFT_93566 [Dictyostelium purpureum]|eukprot:XP_003283932.1 hypothetical protein DICPUDRAFT_93566 [Dictyostelium purpureum]